MEAGIRRSAGSRIAHERQLTPSLRFVGNAARERALELQDRLPAIGTIKAKRDVHELHGALRTKEHAVAPELVRERRTDRERAVIGQLSVPDTSRAHEPDRKSTRLN